MWDSIHLSGKVWVIDKLSIFQSLLENSFIRLFTFFSSSLSPFHPLSGFSLQDSFEYINQDPSLGKLSTNQNNLGACRTGSNLGKISHVNGFFLNTSIVGVCFALFEFVVLFGFLFSHYR